MSYVTIQKLSLMLVVGLANAIAVAPAHAQSAITENLKLRAGIDITNDSNFQRAIDSKAATEQVSTQSLEAALALPYGLQRFELQASIAANTHQTFKQFDYTGQNFNAGWNWSLTPSLVGALGSKRTETLNSAADSIDPTLRNTNVTRSDSVSASYLVGGPWQVFTEYAQSTSTNERALLGITDSKFQSYTAGVSYAPSAGNSLRYSYRADTGTSGSNYDYRDNFIAVTHALTGNTDIKGRIGYLEQRYSVNPKFNFSGPAGSVEANWRASGKTSVNASWSRTITGFQTVDSTYARTDALSISPRWQALPTLALGFSMKRSLRDALGGSNAAALARQDETLENTWDISWQPRKYLLLRGGVSAASRTSNVAAQDFTAQAIKISAQFNY